MIFLTCAVCWSYIPPGPVEAEVKARIEALPVGQSTFKDLAWPETVVDALVDRVIGQSWRTSTQHPPRQPVGLTSARIAESVDPWLPEERASRIGWGNALRPAQANFLGKDLLNPGRRNKRRCCVNFRPKVLWPRFSPSAEISQGGSDAERWYSA